MTTPAFRPLGARYLVLPKKIEAETTSIGEFVINKPSDVHKKATEGTVVSCGTQCTELKPGAIVIFGQFSGYEQVLDGTRYVILQESEILGERLETPFDEPQLPLVMGEIVS